MTPVIPPLPFVVTVPTAFVVGKVPVVIPPLANTNASPLAYPEPAADIVTELTIPTPELAPLITISNISVLAELLPDEIKSVYTFLLSVSTPIVPIVKDPPLPNLMAVTLA